MKAPSQNDGQRADQPASKKHEHHLHALFWIFGGLLVVGMLVGAAVLISPTHEPATVPDERGELPLFGQREQSPELILASDDDPVESPAALDLNSVDFKAATQPLNPHAQDEARKLLQRIGDPVSEPNIQLVLRLHERLERFGALPAQNHAILTNELSKKFTTHEREIYQFMRERWQGLIEKGIRNPAADETILKEAAQKFGITAEKAMSVFVDIDAYVFFREKPASDR